jgi:2-phospho-L-lactate transferase/gluconeogenesis factor (CofD/UPF0052 family)
VAKAVRHAAAVRIYVCNAMTEPGETDGYGVAEHLEAIAAHGLPLDALDYVVAHTAPIPTKILARYAEQGAAPVGPPPGGPTSGSSITVGADLLEPGPIVRHAPDRLGPILCHLATRGRTNGRAAPLPVEA